MDLYKNINTKFVFVMEEKVKIKLIGMNDWLFVKKKRLIYKHKHIYKNRAGVILNISLKSHFSQWDYFNKLC